MPLQLADPGRQSELRPVLPLEDATAGTGAAQLIPTGAVSVASKVAGKLRKKNMINTRPIPEGIDTTIAGIEDAWMWFQKVDEDGGGYLDWNEVCDLGRRLGLNWSRRRLKRAYDEMASDTRVGASFKDFSEWWARQQVIARRDMRRTVKELFEGADVDKSGVLDKKEFAGLVHRANKDSSLPVVGMAKGHLDDDDDDDDAPKGFDLEEAWGEIRKVPFIDDGIQQFGVNFTGFESWWKAKAGFTDPDLPVLPEFMVLKIGDKVKAQKLWKTAMEIKQGTPRGEIESSEGRSRNWTVLADKLRALVTMRRHWGELHDIYETRAESLFDETPLSRWVRDPDSKFSGVWDLWSVVLLLYVTVTVPLRACFGVDVLLYSVEFWIDVIVDVFFVADLCLNMRTSFYDRNGFRENRPKKIAANYLRGWFAIDFVSCLPVGYIQYFLDGSESGGNFKAVKAFRLMKMSKMLRLARIKRILSKYGSDVNFQQYFNIGITVFGIVFLTHLLACFFYLVGTLPPESLSNNEIVEGWVDSESNWWKKEDNFTSGDWSVAANTPDNIDVGKRYVTSMYYVLNALESSYTTPERGFAIFAEFCRDFILGLVASLITTISMSMSNNDNANNLKLKMLKKFFEHKKLPKAFQQVAMEHFNELWTNQSNVDLPDLLNQCPPAMASHMAELLYGRFLSTVPLFKGLSVEVLSALCMHCKPLLAMKNMYIIREGEPGKEMYMIMSGEVEVTERRGNNDERLGFLSEGAFFGEAPVLGMDDTSGSELRLRTVRAVTDSELCFLTKADVHSLYKDYSELKARMKRFGKAGEIVNDKRVRQMNLTRAELETFSKEYKATVKRTCEIRAKENLSVDDYVPVSLMGGVNAIRASNRFKKGAHARLTREQVATEQMPAAGAGALPSDTAANVPNVGNRNPDIVRANNDQTLPEVRNVAQMVLRMESSLGTQVAAMTEQLTALQQSVAVLQAASLEFRSP
eukprot:COSAG05_NODE_1112_length_5856_cov_11.397082_2_plen_976_part_00